MNFHVVTLFPEVVDAYARASILGRAQKDEKLSVTSYQLRDFVTNKWGKADERPYGGGPGMVLQAEPFVRAFEAIQQKIQTGLGTQQVVNLISPSAKTTSKKNVNTTIYRSEPRQNEVVASKYPEVKPREIRTKVLITSAGGKPLTNAYAKKLSKEENVIILCGRYEGIDARVKKVIISLGAKVEEVSVGPYILTGGELPALTIIDTTARQIPGVLGKFESLEEGRVASHDTYTRPEVLEWKDKSGKEKKYRVPKVLLSGNHAQMDAWKDKKRSNPGTFAKK